MKKRKKGGRLLNLPCLAWGSAKRSDLKESALKFLAVYLKAHNPTTKAKHLKHKYGARLHDFTESCTLADRLLAAKKGSVESQAAGATELERLAGMWDDCKARDLGDFLK